MRLFCIYNYQAFHQTQELSPNKGSFFFFLREICNVYYGNNKKTQKEKEIYTMMKLRQLEVTNENIGVLLMSDDVYLIRFKEENKVKLNFIKGHKDLSILPSKLSLVNIKSLSAKDIRKILDEEEVAIVQVTLEES